MGSHPGSFRSIRSMSQNSSARGGPKVLISVKVHKKPREEVKPDSVGPEDPCCSRLCSSPPGITIHF
jgi:hypothetical protein